MKKGGDITDYIKIEEDISHQINLIQHANSNLIDSQNDCIIYITRLNSNLTSLDTFDTLTDDKKNEITDEINKNVIQYTTHYSNYIKFTEEYKKENELLNDLSIRYSKLIITDEINLIEKQIHEKKSVAMTYHKTLKKKEKQQ